MYLSGPITPEFLGEESVATRVPGVVREVVDGGPKRSLVVVSRRSPFPPLPRPGPISGVFAEPSPHSTLTVPVEWTCTRVPTRREPCKAPRTGRGVSTTGPLSLHVSDLPFLRGDSTSTVVSAWTVEGSDPGPSGTGSLLVRETERDPTGPPPIGEEGLAWWWPTVLTILQTSKTDRHPPRKVSTETNPVPQGVPRSCFQSTDHPICMRTRVGRGPGRGGGRRRTHVGGTGLPGDEDNYSQQEESIGTVGSVEAPDVSTEKGDLLIAEKGVW